MISLYIGSRDLIIENNVVLINGGAGSFQTYRRELQLTEIGSNLTDWILPSFFYAKDRSKRLTYHQSDESWTHKGDKVSLKAAPIGQEFVFDCANNPQAVKWVIDLIQHNSR